MSGTVIAGAMAMCLSVLGACSDDSGGDAGTATSQTSAKATGSQDDGDGESPSAEASEAVAVDPDDVIARQTFTLRRNPENTVEVGVVSLEVEGKVATLRMVYTPHFASAADDESVSVYDIYENTGFFPYLLDLANLKRYDIVRTANFAELLASDSVSTSVVNNRPMAVYAVYAAPQDGVSKIDVHVADWWPAFKDVPVKR